MSCISFSYNSLLLYRNLVCVVVREEGGLVFCHVMVKSQFFSGLASLVCDLTFFFLVL